jgi:glycosyltransferase involved in cell wall biosynthesis
MRALHYRQTFSKLSETFLYGYLTELERQGVDCHILTHERRNAEARPFANVTQVNYPEKWDPRRLAYGLLARAGIGGSIQDSYRRERRRRLATVGRDVQPDVVHAHFGREGVFIAPVAKRLGRPLVVTFYGFDISSLPEEDGWAEAYRRMWPRTDAVTVLSKEMKGAALDLGCPEQKISIVHLSRDLEQFPFHAPDRTARRLLFVGRLTPKKAPLDALRALKRANQKGANLRLHIVGDGELRDDVEHYVDEQSLREKVVIHGREPNEKVKEHMQAADAFVLPSKTAPDGDREGTPTVLVEAQATGLPCISTRHAGIPEMIPKSNHDLLVQEGDVEALADRFLTMSTFSTDRLMEIAKRGRQKIQDEFSLSEQCEKLRSIYQSVADG